jgi:ligand-binding SRPBCC domain-containing protein
MYYQLCDAFEVSADLRHCWDFFGRAENLPLITPPWLKFTIAMSSPLPQIGDGTVLDYTIRWFGVRVKWRTKIIDWIPPRQFIDLQIRGPYELWHHQHTFESTESGGVICRDRVIYKLPLPGVRRVVHAVAVRRQLLEIFRFRRKVIAEHLGWIRALQQDVTITRVE